ncbi:PH domain-containing protein [Actinokineospora sp. NPDC004072]
MTVRPIKVRFVAVAFAVVFIAVFTAVGVLLKNQSTGVYFQTSDQVAMIGIGVLLALGALWFTWPKVTADETGVVVRNMLGSKLVPWSDVVAVTFPDGASYARLELPDDEYIVLMAVQSIDRDRAVLAIRELRKLHKAAHVG